MADSTIFPRKQALFIAMLAVIANVAQVAFAETMKARVVGVTDGDTIKCIDAQGRLQKIRLNGIDAPEKTQAFGTRAKEFTAEEANGKEVTIETHGHDRYGRLIGDVYVNGKCLNRELVKNGFAWWYRKYSPHDAELAELESMARARRVGLWSEKAARAPWDFRKAQADARVNAKSMNHD